MQFTAQISRTYDYDVVVCGSGSAGFAAALSAARNGSKVAIVEKNGELGGSTTSGLVGPFMTCFDPSGKRQLVKGIFDELISYLDKKGEAIHPSKTGKISEYGCFIQKRHNNVTPFNPAYMTIAMTEFLDDAGVTLFLNSNIIDVTMDDTGRRITGIIFFDGVEFCRISASVIIDATGNAFVSEKAGVECLQGEPGNPKEIQPMTLFFWIYGADDKKINEYLDRDPEMKYQPFNKMIEQDRKEGRFPIPRSKIGLYHMVHDGEWRLNTTRIQNRDPSNPEELNKAYIEGIRQVDFLMDYFKKCQGLENARLAQIASLLGIRESKRINGEYILKGTDLVSSTPFPDTIALCSYPVDMHPTTGNLVGMATAKGPEVAEIYEIPYRIMVPEHVDGLLVAGRCVSADREALAAIRIMPAAMAMGEAAGAAAALCCRTHQQPREISYEELRADLRKQGACVDK